jgi:predicted nucleotidyltransferase component of viral defense system
MSMLGKLDQQQMRKTAIQLGIPTDFIRKDYFVTLAIQVLINVENDCFSLVFQGGTSLSKGYRVIKRMSEDVDFRVIQKPLMRASGKEARRKKLRGFRYDLIQALKESGFVVPEKGVRVFYEGRFMSIQAEFTHSKNTTYLKPHIIIECFLGDLLLEPNKANITTLMKETLGNECDHASFPVACVALDETAAEKWVALTRRIAGIQIKTRQSDKHLVRHLYDLYHLNTKGLLQGHYCAIVDRIIQKDRIQFKKQHTAYVDNPVELSKQALNLLFEGKQWREHWDHFLMQMVYDDNKPSFEKAYGQLQLMSQAIFKTLKQVT